MYVFGRCIWKVGPKYSAVDKYHKCVSSEQNRKEEQRIERLYTELSLWKKDEYFLLSKFSRLDLQDSLETRLYN